MKHWLLKTEPGTYSFQDLQRDKSTYWDGVRNYQARNNLKIMQRGDLAFIYHSVGPKEVCGVAQVTKAHYPDPTDKTGQWVVIDLKPKQSLPNPVTLEKFKQDNTLKHAPLVRQSRLSVMPLSDQQAKRLLVLGGLA